MVQSVMDPPPNPHRKAAANLNRNNRMLERLQAAYSAVLELSEQGFDVEAIDINPADRTRLTVTRDAKESGQRSGEMIGGGMRRGCEVLLVARGR